MSLNYRILRLHCWLCASLATHLCAEERPVARPPLDVTEKIPLLKVGEYQMVEKRFAPAAVADGDYIYIIGGIDDKHNLLKSIERFDPRTGRSEIFAQLKTARFWHRAVAVGGRIYILGGKSETAPGAANTTPPVNPDLFRASAETRFRNPPAMAMTSVWVTPEDPPADFEDSVEILDLATGSVSPGPKMPDARDQFACAVVEQQLFVLGGEHRRGNRRAFSNTTLVLDLASGKWSPGVPMPTARASDAAVVTGPFIVVPGGYDGRNARDEVEAFNPRTETWATVPALCRATSAHSVAFLGHYLFLFGDYERPNEILAYDLATKKSETFTLQYRRARHGAAVVHDERIYVFGGRESRDLRPLDSIQVFAPPPKKPESTSSDAATTN